MNERIFELAKQADLIQWDSLPSGARTPDHKSVVKARKFAELIVRECVKLQYKNVVVGGVSDYNRGRRELAEEILKHFGVEE